jgi:hypothetical protein
MLIYAVREEIRILREENKAMSNKIDELHGGIAELRKEITELRKDVADKVDGLRKDLSDRLDLITGLLPLPWRVPLVSSGEVPPTGFIASSPGRAMGLAPGQHSGAFVLSSFVHSSSASTVTESSACLLSWPPCP